MELERTKKKKKKDSVITRGTDSPDAYANNLQRSDPHARSERERESRTEEARLIVKKDRFAINRTPLNPVNRATVTLALLGQAKIFACITLERIRSCGVGLSGRISGLRSTRLYIPVDAYER